MITLCTTLTLTGFWVCYQTSRRAELRAPGKLEVWIRHNRIQAKPMGVALLSTALMVCMSSFGAGAGVFTFLILITSVASVVVILAPMELLHWSTIIPLLFALFLLELAI